MINTLPSKVLTSMLSSIQSWGDLPTPINENDISVYNNKFRLISSIVNQVHGYPIAGKDNLIGQYTSKDIEVGDWYLELSSGKALQITTINSNDSGLVDCIIEDVGRFEQFRSGGTSIDQTSEGIFISINPDTGFSLNNITKDLSSLADKASYLIDLSNSFRKRFPIRAKTTHNILSSKQIYVNVAGLKSYELGTFVFSEAVSGKFYGLVDILNPSSTQFEVSMSSSSKTLPSFKFGNDPATTNNNKTLISNTSTVDVHASTVYTFALSNSTIPIPQGLIATITLYFIQE